jgi:hypothetical protein
MSSGAGIPTGWHVAQDLIRRIARADGIDLIEVNEQPESWWASTGRGEPRYDELVGSLGLTDATRQAILRRYFDPPAGEGGRIRHTKGHAALARLVADGRIRVIITTNFDRLIERALDDAGVAAQVISTPAGVRGMTPLAHAPATILKVNGDYATLGHRNTPAELASYPPRWRRLLGQVFDEYGLLVIGWSADYDIALSDALSGAPSRRYPAFWTTYRGHISEPARRLVALRGAAVIDTNGAEEFLIDLTERVDRIEAAASRRGRPSTIRMKRHQPERRSPNSGWAFQPLLVLRTVAEIGPAPTVALGSLRQELRDRLLQSLAASPLTPHLVELSQRQSQSALGDGQPGPHALAEGWQSTPGGYQDAEHGSYRLGGDATSGVSALVDIHPVGGSILVSVDAGLSLAEPISLAEAARVLRDALAWVTQSAPDALTDFLPSDAQITLVEVHLMASDQNADGSNRSNHLGKRVDLGPLGSPTRSVGTSMGYAALVAGPLSDQAAAELVVHALDDMALDSGFLNARPGLMTLRRDLGLPDAGPSTKGRDSTP